MDTAEHTNQCAEHTTGYEPWKDILGIVVRNMPAECAGRLMTVSAEWERVIRQVWRVKPIVMVNGTNVAIWVEVDGRRTYPKWTSGVVVGSGSLKFTKYGKGRVDWAYKQAIANHTAQSTLLEDFYPLMHCADVRKRLCW